MTTRGARGHGGSVRKRLFSDTARGATEANDYAREARRNPAIASVVVVPPRRIRAAMLLAERAADEANS